MVLEIAILLFLFYRALVGESESLPPLTKLVSSPTMSQSLACIPTSWNEQPDHFLQLSPPPSIPAPPCPQYTVSRKYPKAILIFRELHVYTFFHCTTIFSISRTLLSNNQLFKLLPTSPQQETQHY